MLCLNSQTTNNKITRFAMRRHKMYIKEKREAKEYKEIKNITPLSLALFELFLTELKGVMGKVFQLKHSHGLQVIYSFWSKLSSSKKHCQEMFFLTNNFNGPGTSFTLLFCTVFRMEINQTLQFNYYDTQSKK